MGRRVSSPAFVGRDEQLEALAAALRRAGEGAAGAVFVGGESGVGKSRLVAEFERTAAGAGAQFLAGACVDVGGSELPYAPVVAALRPVVREIGPETLAELVGPARDELARLLPELPAAAAASAPADPLAQSRLFEALLGLLARLGESAPLVLAVEDLHWSDPSTRAFLSFLVRNVRRERVLLVATFRTDELHSRHPLRQFLAEVERVPTVERLELARFTRRELAAQLSAILDAPVEPQLVDELYARSQGNAFFAEELLAAAGGGGPGGVPDSLRDALTLRVRELSEETRGMLRTAAAAGSVVGHRLLVSTAGLPEDALVRTVREAIEQNVLVHETGSESYSFRHTLLREALYDDLLPGEGAALHGALARALERDPSLGAAAERASHWYAAHDLPAALRASLEAAAEAERVWAFAEANGHYERAVEVWERVPGEQRPREVTLVELAKRAAEAAHLAGENDRALALGRRALALVDPQDREAAGYVHERLGRYLLARSATLAALEEYRAAAALLPDEPSAVRASILAGQGHVLMLEGEAARSRGLCEEAIAIAREVGAAAVECNALNTLGADAGMLGARDEAIELLEQGKRLAEELGGLEELVRSYMNLGETLDQADRVDEAAALAIEGWQRLRHLVGGVALFLVADASARLVRLGRWDEAADLLEEAVERPRADLGGARVLEALAGLEMLRGDVDAAALHVERARRITGDDVTGMLTLTLRAASAAVALAQGRPEETRALVAALDEPGALGHGFAVFLLPLYALGLRAEAELAARGEREAPGRADKLLEHTRALVGDSWPLGDAPVEALLNAELCELEGARARGEATAEGWAGLAARCDERRRPYYAAYARLREGEGALAEGLPRARVAEALAPARESASRLGARPLLEEIARLARRAGVGLGEDEEAENGRAGLTSRELDVLRLVAEGRTNPEIGKALYMSPKTASVHVSRILAKLDAKTRAEAVDLAHRLGLIDQTAVR